MIEATIHPAEHVFDPFLNLSAEDQAERWLVERLAAAGFVVEFSWFGEGGPRLAGRWARTTLAGGAIHFRQWPEAVDFVVHDGAFVEGDLGADLKFDIELARFPCDTP